ncbi:MAG TPA: HD-GYP domain-containing protein [Pyrinomonadaceae bacterium]|jgi:putative nucleotidyltransferase with HDIG domain
MTATELKSATAGLLAALGLRDKGTRDHSKRVARVSVILGQRLRLEPYLMTALSFGALLHDIGKISTKEAVLKKEGSHTPIERMHMKEHACCGAEMLEELKMPELVTACVRQHHERWDGLGYPRGLKGTEIGLLARIVAVADAYDAMTNNRCYRAGRSHEAAVAEIQRGSGSQFDSDVVRVFLLISQEQLTQIARGF